MGNPWVLLVIAGLCEIGWAIGLKYSDGFTRPVATGVTLVVALVSFVLLSQAMKGIPVGTAYAVWTGIGALGVAFLGIVLFQEVVSPIRLAGIGLIVAGIVALKLA
ncbi:MAG: multidrug efflux SMR transporter [Gemmobacter sp.]|nr:multidrug efflux SMR transporter [Gemmobacter sp.]